ncbi:MAG: PEGA domain-containing protein [Planctomycetota bacterium]
MGAKYFQSFVGKEQELREWLGVSNQRRLADPSLHDLLDLDEMCRDRRRIKQRSVEYARKLRDIEGQIMKSGAPASITLFKQLQGYISSAERALCDCREQYMAELCEHRTEQFLKYLGSHYVPTDPLAGDDRKELLQSAEQRFRLRQDQAEEVLDEYFIDPEIPEPYRNHVKWLKMPVFPEDPKWPTHFDILGVDEAETLSAGVVQRAEAKRCAELPDFSRHPKQDKKREVEAVQRRVQAAAKRLAQDAAGYLEECRKARIGKFKGIVKEHKKLKKGKLTISGKSLLLRAAARLRIEDEAERVISEVFPSGKKGAEVRSSSWKGSASGSQISQQSGSDPPMPPRVTPFAEVPPAALLGGLAGLALLWFVSSVLAVLLSLAGGAFGIWSVWKTRQGRFAVWSAACFAIAILPLVTRGGVSSPPNNDENAVTQVRVETEPAGAEIFVDGKRCGTAPLSIEQKMGIFEIRAEKPGFKRTTQRVSLNGETETVSLELTREPRKSGVVLESKHNTGYVRINLGRLDGLSLGSTVEIELSQAPIEWEGDILGYEPAIYRVVEVDEESSRAKFAEGHKAPPVDGDKVIKKIR